MRRNFQMAILGVLFAGASSQYLHAETGYDAWLRYAPLERHAAQKYESLPAALAIHRSSKRHKEN